MKMSDMFSTPTEASSEAANDGEFVTLEDLKGLLLLVTPVEYSKEIETVHGLKDAVKATVVVLDGPDGAVVHEDILIFAGRLIGMLKGRVGVGPVLGRLTQDKKTAKRGQKPAWQLEDPTDAEKATARQYLSDPFA